MFNNAYNCQAGSMRPQQDTGFNPIQNRPMRPQQGMGFNPAQPSPMGLQQTGAGSQGSSFDPQNLMNVILQLLQQLQGAGSQPSGGMPGGIGGIGAMPQQPGSGAGQPGNGLVGLNPDGTTYTVPLPATPTDPSTLEPPMAIPGAQHTYTGPTPIPVSYSDNRTTLGNLMTTGQVVRSDAQMREQFEQFKNSDQYPAIETMDMVTTPWGYQGSSSALAAFNIYTWEQGPVGIA